MMTTAFDIAKVREQFPILHQQVNGYPLVYFDNAASSQKPLSVINALRDYYLNDHANIHRGAHTLAARATEAYEATRKKVAEFIGAGKWEEIVFTRGTTESINLVAQAYARPILKPGDEIVLTHLEHHSNIVPWQMVAEKTGAIINVIPVTESGELDLRVAASLISSRTKIVAFNYISNSLGTINPVTELVQMAHEVGAVVLLDAAQAAPHVRIDVRQLDVDFLALSSHKMYGPTGVGVLYGKEKYLEQMEPYQGGGEMIKEVSFKGTTYNSLPYKFEAGTPNVGDVVAFHKAMDFIEEIGYETLQQHEHELLVHATNRLNALPKFRPVGTAANKSSVISFLIDGIHPFDLGMWLDAKGIAVRTGHHCTQPLMDRFGIEGTVRASFAIYNTIEEVNYFVDALEGIIKKFAP
jgi:cysteine desulfurase / selenocysteine lyase